MGLVEFIMMLNAMAVQQEQELLLGDEGVLWGDEDTTFED